MESERLYRTPLPNLRLTSRAKRPVEMLERVYQWWTAGEDRIAELGNRLTYEEISDLTGVPKDEVIEIYKRIMRAEANSRGNLR